jgi:hypothetical protein
VVGVELLLTAIISDEPPSNAPVVGFWSISRIVMNHRPVPGS